MNRTQEVRGKREKNLNYYLLLTIILKKRGICDLYTQ